ncbi:hypothetical protein NKG94_16115 [Micromonospora sp. M12]
MDGSREPLPVEERDTLRAIHVPGWLVSGTCADGIVRVVNHGTDHAVEGATVSDSPLYARLGYSTATTPVLDDSGWAGPLDQSVTSSTAGSVTHRAGMRLLTVHVDTDGVGVAGHVPSPTGSTRIRVSAITAAAAWGGLDRPGTSRCTRWSAAPGSYV